MKTKNIILILLFLMKISFGNTQNLHTYFQNTNVWLMYFGDHRIGNNWGVHLEGQIRRSDFLKQSQQLLLRFGVNYHINKTLFTTLGYAFIETFPYGEQPVKSDFPEHRIWEQVQVKSQLEKIEWVSRFRLEQRFSYLPILKSTTNTYEHNNSATYTNRVRLLNRFSIPINSKTIEDNTFFVSAYDEVFINFGKNIGKNVFDQNRLYCALGYKIKSVGRMELGYLNQKIFKSDGISIENNHTIQLGLSSNIDLIKNKS